MYPDIFKSRRNREILREVLGEFIIDEAAALPATEQPAAYFTPEYEAYMNKLIKKQQKVYYYWTNTTPKKVACVLVAILLMAIITTFSVSALRKAFLRFIAETYETFTSVAILDDPTVSDEAFSPMSPTYIPDGYTLISETQNGAMYTCVYQNAEQKRIRYYQTTAKGNFVLDTEGVTYEKIYVKNHEALYYYNKENHMLFINQGTYVYMIFGNGDKEEMIKMMSSINF